MKKLLPLAVLLGTTFFAAAQQNVGIGTNDPKSKLDVNGGITIGNTYSGVNTAPTNGAIIEGAVGIGTPTPNSKAALDVSSSTKGMFLPRLTTAEATTLGNTLNTTHKGLMIFNTTTTRTEFWDGTQWKPVGDGAGGPPSGAAGGDLTGTYPNPTVANSAINSAKILDGSITGTDIQNNTIDLTTKVNNVLPVSNGGTGVNTVSGIIQGNGGSPVTGVTASAGSQYMRRNSTNTAYEFGQINYSDVSGTPTALPPSGTAGGDLQGTYPNPTIKTDAVTSTKILDGTVTSADIADGTVAAVDLVNSGATAGTYGSATTTPVVTVDAKGRVTSVTNTTISGVAPSGAAGGDLTGTYPNPTITTNAVGSAEITDNTVASADISDGTIVAADLANTGVTAGTYNNVTVNTKGQVTGASNVSYLTGNQTVTLTGDVTGSGTTSIGTTIAANAVNSGKIQDGTVSSADMTATGVGAGTYTKVTVDAAGRVTSAGALSASDIPDISGTYVKNQTAQQAGANFNVAGSGVVGSTMQAGSYIFPAPAGDPSPVITARTVPAGQGAANERTELILFHSNDPANGSGDDLITLRAPSIRLQTYNDATVGDINNAAGSVDRLFVRYDGNVGIGTSAPSTKLHLYDGAPSGVQANNALTKLLIDAPTGGYTEYRTTADNNSYAGMIFTDNNLGGYVAFRNSTDDRLHIGGYTGITFEVGTDNNVGGKAERMRVDNNGNVGIGTTGPGGRLDVRGNLSGLTDFGILTVGDNAGQQNGIAFGYDGGNNWAWMYARTTGCCGRTININNTAYVQSGGSVGIGTSGPAYKLHVTGDIYANGGWFRVSGNQGYYFESYGGGWQMLDGTWLRSYNAKPIMATGGIVGNGNGGLGTAYNTNPRMYANYDNVNGGGIMIADDGGFFDYNDAWIQFRGSTGLQIRSNSTGPLMQFGMYNVDNGGTVYDKTVTPMTNNFGLLGYSGLQWWYGYAGSGWYVPSRRELKRQITPVEDGLNEMMMADIDRIRPTFYKLNVEQDEFTEEQAAKYRANMHLGIILDESPDYVQDPTFTGVDMYGLATLALAGVKDNRREVKEIKEQLGMNNATTEVHDFGVASINGTSTTVQFDKDFKGALPVVNVTATKPGVYLAVTNVTANSFTIESDKALDNMQFNWMAFGKVKTSAERKAESNTTSSEVMEAIKVNPSIKERIQNYWLKELPAKLKADEEKAKQEAVAVTEERAKEINNGAKFADPAKGPVKVNQQ